MAEWDADIAIDAPLVRRLLQDQFAELDAASARLVGEGWDNSVWAVEDRFAFRFPRREVAAPLVARELDVLPRLAPLLPVAIPTPTFVGVPGHGYPWPFYGSPLLPGREAPDARPTDRDRLAVARQLGRFLRVLHDVELSDVRGALGDDPLGRADMEVRVPRARARLSALAEHGLWEAPLAAEELLQEASALPRPAPVSLVHGDLHFRHVLVEGAELTGVIDWGDMCHADPAVDLVLYWCLLQPEARRSFVDAYGPIARHRLVRSRVLSLFLCAILLEYAHREGLAHIERAAREGLELTFVD